MSPRYRDGIMALAKGPGHPMETTIVINNKVKDHRGRPRIQLSKYWPDGSRYKRYAPNPTVAKKIEARIDEAIAMGTWKHLKKEFTRGVKPDLTIAEFAETYLNDYCRVRNKRPDCKEQVLESVTEIVGDVPLKSFRRSHAHHFIAVRSKQVAPATVNRGIAVLKNMLTFALDRELIDVHPLLRFRMLVEEKPALRVMTLQEERHLIECIEERVIRAYAALLGETALRKQEGLSLKWEHINFGQRVLAVEHTKSRKARYIPLSDVAIDWLRTLMRVVGCPYVFVRLQTSDRWRKPEGPFREGRPKAGLEWVTIHDLRHFRATQWVQRGVDPGTVQELLGHSSITKPCATRISRRATRPATLSKRSGWKLRNSQAKNRPKRQPKNQPRFALMT